MKTSEIKSLSIDELKVKVKTLNEELFNLRFSHATRNLANPLAIRNVRRDISKVKTALREKEIAEKANGGNNGR